jgi:DNA-binding NtrC family response regulator
MLPHTQVSADCEKPSILFLGNPHDSWIKNASKYSQGDQFTIDSRPELPIALEQNNYQIILIDQATSEDTIANCRNHFQGSLFLITTSKSDWQLARQALRDGATDCFARVDGAQVILEQIRQHLKVIARGQTSYEY